MTITLTIPSAQFSPSEIRQISKPPPHTKESAQENVNFHILGTVSEHSGSKIISGVEGSMMRLREHRVS